MKKGKSVEHISQIHTYFDSQQGNNQDARQEYIDFKAQYNKEAVILKRAFARNDNSYISGINVS